MNINQLLNSNTVCGANPVTPSGANPVDKMQIKNLLTGATADDTVNHRHQEHMATGQHDGNSGQNQTKESIAWQDIRGRHQVAQFLGWSVIHSELGEKLTGLSSVEKYRLIRRVNTVDQKMWTDPDMQVAAGISSSDAAEVRLEETGGCISRLIQTELSSDLAKCNSLAQRYRLILDTKQQNGSDWNDEEMQLAAGISSSNAASIKNNMTGTAGSHQILTEVGERLSKMKSKNDQFRLLLQIRQDEGKSWSDKDMQLAIGIHGSTATRLKMHKEAGENYSSMKMIMGNSLDGLASTDKYRLICRINREQNHMWSDKAMQQFVGINLSSISRIKIKEEGTAGSRVIKSELGHLLDQEPKVSARLNLIEEFNDKNKRGWSDKDMHIAAGAHLSNLARRRRFRDGTPGSRKIEEELGPYLTEMPTATKRYRFIYQTNHDQNKGWSERDMQAAAKVYSGKPRKR